MHMYKKVFQYTLDTISEKYLAHGMNTNMYVQFNFAHVRRKVPVLGHYFTQLMKYIHMQ